VEEFSMTQSNNAAREVVFVSACRTAIGSFGGSLSSFAPTELGAIVTREAVKRAGVNADHVGHVVFGHVINTQPADMYLARVAAIQAGLNESIPALTVNRLCGSGLQAVVSAAQALMLGDCEVAVAGGAESMSRAPYALPSARWGARMGDTVAVDMLNGALSDPFNKVHMGMTAERVAKHVDISREQQDALAVESHARATRAISEGRFKEQIVPVEIKVKRQTVLFDTDEHARSDVTQDNLAKLRPVFDANGSVTAGNASGINDGAAAVVMASADYARKNGLRTMGRLVGYAHAGVEPMLMGLGPVPAVKKLLEKTGVALDQVDVIEANEAFAAQACAVAKQLGFDPAKTNPNGSGIALGHPVGATGAILCVKALHELHRIGGRYALVTMCIGGGQGIAALIERTE
jgi:acetyl-CoA C-acetyltransferase